MPASKRRVSGGPTAASKAKAKSQSTLAFHGKSAKVTKPGSGAAGKAKTALKEESAEPVDLTLDSQEEVKEEEPTTADLSLAEQAEAEAKAPLTTEEEEAGAVKEAQIRKYWREKEAVRKAPRIHQEDLSLHEKVCREFDTDGRYGVSTRNLFVCEKRC
jgi:DNA polymerase delta subunit 4